MTRPLEEKLRDRTARVGVVGLGVVGLPDCELFAQAGFPVIGFDISEKRVGQVNLGVSYIDDVDSGALAHLVQAGRLRAYVMPEGLHEPDCYVIAVPTPLDIMRNPDLSCIVQATEAIADHFQPGSLVVLESTTYPGTTVEVVKPILEKSGLRAGSDFFLAFSPERVDPGDSAHRLSKIPKVVGGYTERCGQLAALLFEQVVPRAVVVSSPMAAEMVKLLENTFRSVNIGLVNELALMCHKFGLNVWEVIEDAATKPFGFTPFYPGPGVGGHCIPIDALYLSWKARQFGFESRFIEAADQINTHMPHHVVQIISDVLNRDQRSVNGSKILAVGVAYKRNIADMRESPALDVLKLLDASQAELTYHDPLVLEIWLNRLRMESVALTPKTVAAADCVVILTDHGGVDYPMIVREGKKIVDTRNVLRGWNDPKIARL